MNVIDLLVTIVVVTILVTIALAATPRTPVTFLSG